MVVPSSPAALGNFFQCAIFTGIVSNFLLNLLMLSEFVVIGMTLNLGKWGTSFHELAANSDPSALTMSTGMVCLTILFFTAPYPASEI